MRTPILASFLILLPACSVDVQFASSAQTVGMIPERDGPPFAQAFPDPTILVTTTDLAETRKKLAETPLPQTKEHQQKIRALLDTQKTLGSEHVVLLTEAIYLPHRDGDAQKRSRQEGGTVSIATINGRTYVHSRQVSDYSHYVDEILVAGARKLRDHTPSAFGRLLAATMTEQAVIELSNLLLEKCDDESKDSLREILEAIPFSEVRSELCVQVLVPRGRLRGGRTDVALDFMNFDGNRIELAKAIYAELETMDAATLIRHVRKQSFDQGRTELARLGAPLVESMTAAEAVSLVKLASFDAGRLDLLTAVRDQLRLEQAGNAADLIGLASFDQGRAKMLKIMLAGRFPDASERDLHTIARLASFDDGRSKMLAALQPKFDGAFTRAGAQTILKLFSFDRGRIQFVEMYLDALSRLSKDDRMSLASTMTFDSGKKDALRLLAK